MPSSVLNKEWFGLLLSLLAGRPADKTSLVVGTSPTVAAGASSPVLSLGYQGQ